MQYRFRFVGGEQFSLDLIGSESIRDVKRMVCNRFSDVDPEIVKLIFRSSILQDSDTITDLKIESSDVIHVQKRSMRPRVLPYLEEDTGARELVPGYVTEMMSLGFSREQVDAALRDTYGDIERALAVLTGTSDGARPKISIGDLNIGSDLRDAVREKMIRDISAMLVDLPPEMREAMLNRCFREIRNNGIERLDIPLDDLKRDILARCNMQHLGGLPMPPRQVVDPRIAAIERLCRTPAGMILGRDVVIEIFRGSGEDEARAAAALQACMS